MSFSTAEEAEAFFQSLQVGGTIVDGGFVSASPSSSIAGGFVDSGNTGFFFRLRTSNANGAYIAAEGVEPEFLLQRLSTIRIDAINTLQSGQVVIDGTIGL